MTSIPTSNNTFLSMIIPYQAKPIVESGIGLITVRDFTRTR